MRPAPFLALILGLSVACASLADAKDNPGKAKGHSKGQGNSQKSTPGKGPKTIPPGQIKRYTRGAKLPSDLVFVDILDLSKWKLKPPGKGNRYIRVNDQVLKVTRDLSTVVEAVGIVSDLLK